MLPTAQIVHDCTLKCPVVYVLVTFYLRLDHLFYESRKKHLEYPTANTQHLELESTQRVETSDN